MPQAWNPESSSLTQSFCLATPPCICPRCNRHPPSYVKKSQLLLLLFIAAWYVFWKFRKFKCEFFRCIPNYNCAFKYIMLVLGTFGFISEVSCIRNIGRETILQRYKKYCDKMSLFATIITQDAFITSYANSWYQKNEIDRKAHFRQISLCALTRLIAIIARHYVLYMYPKKCSSIININTFQVPNRKTNKYLSKWQKIAPITNQLAKRFGNIHNNQWRQQRGSKWTG